MREISYGRQFVDSEDELALCQVLTSDWLTMGPRVDEFERELSTYVGAPTLSVSSGTAALHTAFAAIQIKPGDEVITPPLTFIATQATACLFGAKIVFSDIDIRTKTLNPDLLIDKITGKTKAIVVVDYAGHPGYLDELREIASSRGIFLIEDAAHSLGSTYKGKSIGSIADITCFSFFPTKNITTGEGGALTALNSNHFKRAKRFARQGMVRESNEFHLANEGPWHQEVQEFGLNYRLSELHAALGVSQLRKIEQFKKRRNEIFEGYFDYLEGVPEINLPYKSQEVDPMWHLFSIGVPESKRLKIYKKMREKGILVQVNYLPAYRHPVFKSENVNPSEFPISEWFYARQLSLPIHLGISDEDIEFISNTLIELVKE